MTGVCPECKSGQQIYMVLPAPGLKVRLEQSPSGVIDHEWVIEDNLLQKTSFNPDHQYRCSKCHHTFNTPEYVQ